jgi:hypothetical protein
MIFWKKKLNSEEYENLCKKIGTLAGEIADFKLQLRVLDADLNNLKGRFNRKLSGLAKEEEKVAPKEEEKPAEPKDLNIPEPLVFTGINLEHIPK